jgi:hypothetical protein
MRFFSKMKNLLPGLHVALILLCLLLTTTAVWAQSSGSLKLKYPVSGASFKLYKIADADADGVVTIDTKFKDCNVDITNTDRTAYKTAAATLADFIQSNANNFEALQTQSTDDTGWLAFDGLTRGIYLVVGETKTVNGTTYTPQSSLISIPQTTDEYGTRWDATAELKYSKYTPPPGGTVPGTPSDSETPGTEDTETGITDTVNIVKNFSPEDTETETETEIAVTEDVTTLKASIVPVGKRLPQTGQLWWPVAALSAAGLCFITVGLKRRRDKQ